ncbi:unnamed protein product [Phaedon cochleariae]|uniref:Uncharacterized protein n=1 Tax=Phaedon cochleariae TaxID=80249 RepID=A0A9N9SC90_PHACE|nr:unnamed protein product [Phaedon cochleariae]
MTQQGQRELRSKSISESTIMDPQTKIIIRKVTDSINAKIVAEFETLNMKFTTIQTKIEQNKKSISDIDHRLDKVEQYFRRCNLRIHGIEFRQQEDTAQTVANFVKNILKINNFSTKDIECCYHIPNQSLFVKSYSYNVEQIVHNAKKLLKETKILIREDLTPFGLKAIAAASAKYGARSAWTMDGDIRMIINNKVH